MNHARPLIFAVLITIALAAPATAAAADPVTVADPTATHVTALDGTIVWISHTAGFDVLMQKSAGGVARVKTVPRAKLYSGIDLGHDTHGRLVLTYLRCKSFSSCTPIRDDLKGHRTSLHGLAPKGCRLSTAPAIWRSRTVAGADCPKKPRQGGLYLKTAGRLRHLPLPKDAVKFNTTHVTSVDIAGSRVGSVVADVFTYSFIETTDGKHIHAAMTADQEGDDDGNTVGFSISGASAWALTTFAHAGDPNESDIVRVQPSCNGFEALKNASEAEEGFKATDIAVDGARVYLLEPGIGIVRHKFVPQRPCN